MTMETNANQIIEPPSSSMERNARQSVMNSVKKPPGEIDPKDYEVEDDCNDNEELSIGDTSNYNVSQRNDLFQKGLDFEKEGKRDLALKCYLSCLKGLKNKTRFVLLPECLKNIADIYQAKGEYGNAIHFAQAEKLFYETALVETQEIQRRIEEVTGSLGVDGSISPNLSDLSVESLRAEEYEHLAQLCLDKKQPQLALEYTAKCAKIRQQVYGSNHVKTRETLDLFASIYAEVGKEQYSVKNNNNNSAIGLVSHFYYFLFIDISTVSDIQYSMLTLTEFLDGYNDSEHSSTVPEVIQTNRESEEPVSILRQRPGAGQNSDKLGSSEIADKEKKQVRFHQSVDESIRRKRREEFISLAVTLLLLAVCFLILIALGVWLYCSIEKGRTCPAIESKFRSWIMTIRYYVNRLTSTTSSSSPKMAYSR